MADRRRHLLLKPHALEPRAACGVISPRRHTKVPAEVDCQRCHHSVQMADAEVAQQQVRRFFSH